MFEFKDVDNIALKATVEDLKKIFSNILKEVNYGSILCYNQTFNGFYRARKHDLFNGKLNKDKSIHLFTSESEFWHPPKQCVLRRGRCNDIKESMFYCSNEFETAIAEVRPDLGKFITVANFRPNIINGKLPSFRIKPVCIQHLQRIVGHKSCVQKFDLTKRNKLLLEADDYFDTLFTEIVSDSNEYRYKITVAITKCMLADIMNDNNDIFSTNGMIYPSIVKDNKSINILLKPIYAENNFQIVSLQTFQVIEENNKGFLLKFVRNGNLIGYKDYPSIKLNIKWTEITNGDSTYI